MRIRDLVAVGILLGFLYACAHIGAAKSERAHRAIDLQTQTCIDRYGFGTDNFRTCVWGRTHDR